MSNTPNSEFVCIVCPNGCPLTVKSDQGKIAVTGNKCPKGIAFATEELTAPKRSVTTTVATVFKEMPVVSVRTSGEIPKSKITELMSLAKNILIDTPKKLGEIVIPKLFDTNVNLIITTDMFKVLGKQNG